MDRMCLNEAGLIVQEEWLCTAKIRNNVEMDYYGVMPNHIHGIIILNDVGRDTSRRAPTREQFGKPTKDSIPTIMCLFKSTVTKRVNKLWETSGISIWRRGYYEHIICNEKELNLIRDYIANNVLQWAFDKNNPENERL